MKKRKWKTRGIWLPLVLGLALFVAVAMGVTAAIRQTAVASDAEGLALAERAVRRAAVSCYAVEGAYPSTYEYLKSHYGVSVDEDRYVVFYEAFASNLMPEITVVERGVSE
jgi:hypothetical protein